MTGMTIAGLARAAGVGVETVRYYQRRGLLDVPAAAGGGGRGAVRRYGVDAHRRLGFIRSAQAAGFTLEEIVELLALDATDDRARVRALALDRIGMLDRRIRALRTARTALRRLADECAEGGAGPCPILTAFEQARPVAKGGGARG